MTLKSYIDKITLTVLIGISGLIFYFTRSITDSLAFFGTSFSLFLFLYQKMQDALNIEIEILKEDRLNKTYFAGQKHDIIVHVVCIIKNIGKKEIYLTDAGFEGSNKKIIKCSLHPIGQNSVTLNFPQILKPEYSYEIIESNENLRRGLKITDANGEKIRGFFVDGLGKPHFSKEIES